MKNLRSYIVFLLFGLAGIFSACQEQLDDVPNSVVVTENAITDQRSAEVALNGAYFRFANGVNWGQGPMVNWQNHELIGSALSGTMSSPYLDDTYGNHTVSFEDGWVSELWFNNYQVVNTANGVVLGVDKLPASKFSGNRKNEILGEARFLRAYGHWSLLSFFGQFFDPSSAHGILLRKDFVTSENINLPKTSVSECYTHILEDIDFAIANAPAENEPDYATKWAAMMLKARVLINRGANGDHAEVVTLTQNIIESGSYSLESNVHDLFAVNGLESNEVILGITPQAGQLLKEENYLQYINWRPSDYLKTLLENDPRMDWMVATMEDLYGDEAEAVTKYVGDHHEVSYAFRLTEAYLLQAEALIRSGGSIDQSKDLLKTVLGKVGVTDFSEVDAADADELRILIFEEVARNLSFEDGQDWFALLRLPMTTIQTLQPTITQKEQFILPIPKNEIERNKNIIQNPGYGQ